MQILSKFGCHCSTSPHLSNNMSTQAWALLFSISYYISSAVRFKNKATDKKIVKCMDGTNAKFAT